MILPKKSLIKSNDKLLNQNILALKVGRSFVKRTKEQNVVSIVLPVYNEASKVIAAFALLYKELKKLRVPFELIFVNDGSTDNTLEALQVIKRKYRHIVRLVSLRKNKGKGFALKVGSLLAKGNIIIFFDADLDISISQVKYLVFSSILHKNFYVIVTDKWNRKSNVIAHFIRKIFSKITNLLARAIIGLNIKDTQAGAKAFRREMLLELLPKTSVKRYAFDIELLLLAKCKGYKILTCPLIGKAKLKNAFRAKEILFFVRDLVYIMVKKFLGVYN